MRERQDRGESGEPPTERKSLLIPGSGTSSTLLNEHLDTRATGQSARGVAAQEGGGRMTQPLLRYIPGCARARSSRSESVSVLTHFK